MQDDSRGGPLESQLPLADKLAAYAHRLSYDDLDAATIERVKALIVDTIGCGMAAFDDAPVRICREVALAAGGGQSTIIGTHRRAPPDLAAFANGAAFRYLDLNDVYVGRPSTHPSDNIAACIAVAEAEGASARDLITAIVLAYEINCRLVDAFDLSDRGWDAPFFSLPAVALAAGKLMGAGVTALAHAVAIAINDHIPLGQTRAQALSDWKGLADAEAGRNAVFAAGLARAGITGPAPIFEGRKGVFALITGAGEVDVDRFGGRAAPFKVLECGMKAYPVLVYGQTTILAAQALSREIGDIEQIAAIEIATNKRGYQQGGSEPEKWAPRSKATADHSLPFIAARTLLDGDIGQGSFDDVRLRDPRVIDLMRKTTVSEDPAFARPKGNAPATRISATLKDGRRHVVQVDDMPGFAGKPLSRTALEAKFRSLSGQRWTADQGDEILRDLWRLEEIDDLAALLGRFDQNHQGSTS